MITFLNHHPYYAIIVAVIFLTGYGLYFIGHLISLAESYQHSRAWLLGALLAPFISVVYCVFHWNKSSFAGILSIIGAILWIPAFIYISNISGLVTIIKGFFLMVPVLTYVIDIII